MKVHGTPESLVIGLQGHLEEGKYPMREIARIADAIYERIFPLFKVWSSPDFFSYYLEEAPKMEEWRSSLPFHLRSYSTERADINDLGMDVEYESPREAASFFRSEYKRVLAAKNPEWNEALTYLISFSENMRFIIDTLKKETIKDLPGLDAAMTKLINVTIKK